MPNADRIDEEGKRQVISLLNEVIQIEYGFILNYPRIIDQMTLIEEIPDTQLPKEMHRLGTDSCEHSGQATEMIVKLGGSVAFSVEVIPRMIDIHEFLVQQIEKEGAAESVYTRAKRLAEQHAVNSGGLFGSLRALTGAGGENLIGRSELIQRLDRMASQEKVHARIAEDLLAVYDSSRQKSA